MKAGKRSLPLHAGRSTYVFQPETLDALVMLTPGTLAATEQLRGMVSCEPLIVIFDSFLRYAKAYRKTGDCEPLATDYVLGVAFRDAMKAAHALLDGQGALANEKGWSTDSKCNGAVESIYWAAVKAAGFTEEEWEA